MKRLQNKIKRLRAELKEIRSDLFFQSLPKEERTIYFESMVKLDEFEDILIFNHILKKNGEE